MSVRNAASAALTGLAIALVCALPARSFAQSASQEAAREYTLPAGPLARTLNQIAVEAGLVLSVDPELVEGRRAAPVQGRMAPREALTRALRGSGLRLAETDAGTLRLDPEPAGAATPILPAVKVSADTESETARGPVDGYVAKRSATGSKTDTALIETPQAINVVTADEIANRGGGRSLTEVLAYTPGFFNAETVDTRNDYGGSLRGFAVYDALYLDGLRLPNGLDRAVPQIEPYGLERVEVLKGPASVLYGQNAPGGVINMVSKRPKAQRGAEMLFAVGTHDQLEGSLDLTGPLAGSQTLLYRIAGFVRDSETQVDFVDDNRLYLAPSLTWVIGPDTQLTLLSHYQDDEGGEFSNLLPAAGTRDPSPNGEIPVGRYTGEPDFDQYDRRQIGLGYAGEHRFSDAWAVSQDFRYLDLDVDYRNVIFPALADDGRTVDRTLYFFDEALESYTVDNRSQLDFQTGRVRHTLLAGIDYRRHEVDSDNGYYFGEGGLLDVFEPTYGQPLADLPNNGVSTIEGRQLGYYLQDQIRVDRWVLTLGGRYDEARSEAAFNGAVYEEHDDEAFTGRAGVVYLFDSGFAPYASYSESFEPPFRATVDYFGEPFDPLTGEQIEVGLKYQPGHSNSFITVSLFDLAQKNVLTEDLEHQDEGFFQKQIGEVAVRGVEVEGKASLARLDLTASYALLDSEYARSDDGNEGFAVSGVPRHQASIWGVYRLIGALDGLQIGGGLRHNGSFHGDAFQEWSNGALTLVDLMMSYDLGRSVGLGADKLRLTVNARNVADEEYVNCAGANLCSYGATRTVQGTVAYRW